MQGYVAALVLPQEPSSDRSNCQMATILEHHIPSLRKGCRVAAPSLPEPSGQSGRTGLFTPLLKSRDRASNATGPRHARRAHLVGAPNPRDLDVNRPRA
jgi:hypothetical protein